jgi:hypothetical protein
MVQWFDLYGLTEQQKRQVVPLNSLTLDAAIDDERVPPENRELNALMRPFLTVVDVLHCGFEEGKVIAGQLVVHQHLASDFQTLFINLFKLKFPIYAVVPQAVLGYNDQEMMLRNYSSCYRPEWMKRGESISEHTKAAALDLNTGPNPEVKIKDGASTFNPEGATYDPTALGTLYEGSEAVTLIRDCGFAWGGGWGNPDAPEYYKHPRVDAHFDYQHVELSSARSVALDAYLPPELRGM